MTIAAIMQELAEVVAKGTDLGEESCFWYPERRISPDPAAWLIMLPRDVNPNSTYSRKAFEVTLEGYLLAPTTDAETAVRTLTKYMDRHGDNSIVEAIQNTQGQNFDTAVVTGIRNEPATLFGVVYYSTRYTIQLVASR